MIPSKILNQFLYRPLNDHRWMKELGHKQLDRMIGELRPKPKLHPHLRLHQKVAFFLGVQYGFEDLHTGGGFSFWIDMGGGKTLIILELLKYWFRCGELRKAIVFVMTDKAYSTWEDQVKEYNIGLPICALEGTSEQKWRQLDSFDEGIMLVHYPGAVAMCSTAKVNKRTGKTQWKLDRKKAERFMRATDILVMDESTRVGHHQSVSHRLCNFIADRVKIRYALAGLPFGRNPETLWAQQKIIDGGLSFGPTLELFRAALYTKEKNKFSKSRWAWKYTFDKQRRANDLARMMQHRSITYEEHEMIDVPPVMYQRVVVPLKGQAREMYLRAREELKQVTKRGAEFVAVKNLFLRMRQITSGYLGFKSKDGRTKTIELEKTKLEALISHIEDLRPDRKVVVFYDYTPSGFNITNELNKRKIPHAWIWAGTKNFRDEMRRFLTNKGCRVLVINSKVGAYSLDGLQKVANYIYYYESPVPVIDRKQSEKRVKRPGQKRRVWIVDFVCKGTVDERILDFHKEGSDLMAKIRKDPRALLRRAA